MTVILESSTKLLLGSRPCAATVGYPSAIAIAAAAAATAATVATATASGASPTSTFRRHDDESLFNQTPVYHHPVPDMHSRQKLRIGCYPVELSWKEIHSNTTTPFPVIATTTE
ncbi:hypothetical protein HZH68_007642 [Vespula germanica]|uniref:Uncharacterized protein n=1 Tax=Vespula germanica TaxID=30212 RepID=A0A834NA52_VESGE|nr:hypothetical protein HZH68_007642 [Vespula germanica]